MPGFGAERRAMDAVRRERAFRSKMPLLAGPEMTVDDEVVMDKRVPGSGRMLYRTSDCGRISPGSGEAGLAQEISEQVLPVEVSRAGGRPATVWMDQSPPPTVYGQLPSLDNRYR